MRSKAYHAFEQKLIYFDDDVELIDILRECVIGGDLTENGSQHVLKRLKPTKHKHIARRQNSVGSRKLIINHLRSSVYSSYVKDIYEEVTEYFKTILKKASSNGFSAGRIVGEHSFKLDAKYILELGNWDNVCQMVTDSVFQSLETERSTLKLLEKVASKLGLNVAREHIEAALPYLETRHFLIHCDGKLTDEFKQNHPHIRCENDYLALDYTFISKYRESVKKLVHEYDKEVIRTNLLKPEDTMP